MTDWQPIDTAPKDGTEVLIWDGSSRRIVTYMHDDEKTGEPVWFSRRTAVRPRISLDAFAPPSPSHCRKGEVTP